MSAPNRILLGLEFFTAVLFLRPSVFAQEEAATADAEVLTESVQVEAAGQVFDGPSAGAVEVQPLPATPGGAGPAVRVYTSSSPSSAPSTGPRPERPSQRHGERGKEEEKEKAAAGEKEEGKPDQKESKEAPKPIQRESTPPQPPNPKELEVRPDEAGMLQLNFSGQPWPAVLGWLAEISHKSLDWQELPGDYLNLTTERKYSVREVRDLINAHLLMRGYTLLQSDEGLSVVKVDKINPAMVPRVTPEELEEREPHEFVKVSFTLDWLLAEAAAEEFKPMLSPNGKLVPLKATNRLEAMDAVENLQQIHELLIEEQSTSGQERLVREFVLKHSSAEEVLEQLQELLGIEQKSSKSGRPTTPQQMRAQAEALKRAQEAAKKGGQPPKPKAEVYLVANKRKNSILANAPPDKMAVIEQAIEAIDRPPEHTEHILRNMDRMQVYRLQSVEPDALIKILKELGQLDYDTRLEADDEHHAIIAWASPVDHMTIRALIDQLDKGGRRAEIVQLVALRAESVARTIDFMMGGGREEEAESQSRSRGYFPFFPSYGRSSSRRGSEEYPDRFRVDADVKTNRLLLWCNDFERKKVEELLENLRKTKTEGDENAGTVETYRLVTLDPEPFVKTLEDMETLGFGSKLEVDEENNAIIAYASEDDHAKIRELIEKLDGSSREFEVIQLRRLEADYVAGTIEFMMAGKQEQQSGYSRTYYVYDIYGAGPSRGSRKDKKPDEFRVDADVESNRLLLWANEAELQAVTDLLVKLGEVPPEGGDPRTIRVLDVLPDEEVERLLDQLQRAWPSVAPNRLVPPLPEKSEKEGEKDKPKESPAKAQGVQAAAVDNSALRRGRPSRSSDLRQSTARLKQQPDRPVFRFAELEEPRAETANGNPSQQADSEATPAADSGQEAPPSGGDVREAASKPDKPPAGPSSSKDAAEPPPVSISRAPDGRLVITSEDTEALDLMEELIARLAPPRSDVKIIRLRYAWAYSVKLTLEEIFEEEEEKPRQRYPYFIYDYDYRSSGSKERARLSKRQPLKFICDSSSNSILVMNADPSQLARIEKLIEFFDQPEPADSESIRKMEVVEIHYSKASVVADAVKDVYRDLLSANDKALIDNQRRERPSERSYTYVYATGDGEEKEQRAPSFKGLLSIGVDELSNTLVVSAPGYLMEDIRQIIQSLDEAAKPNSDVLHVVQLKNAGSTEVQEALSKVLGRTGANQPPSAKTPPGQPGRNRPPSRRSGNNRRRRSSR